MRVCVCVCALAGVRSAAGSGIIDGTGRRGGAGSIGSHEDDQPVDNAGAASAGARPIEGGGGGGGGLLLKERSDR